MATIAPVIPIIPQPRPEHEYERRARVLLGTDIPAAEWLSALRQGAEAVPGCAGLYNGVAEAMKALIAARDRS